MVRLEPMSRSAFDSWLAKAVREYADNKARAGNFAPETALEDAAREFRTLLPDGPGTEGNFLYTVVAAEDGRPVGMLWFARRSKDETFIYDIRMDETERGKGYGRGTLRALEEVVRGMGIGKISLHAFGDNEVAIGLYRSEGFVVTNVLMAKTLGPSDGVSA